MVLIDSSVWIEHFKSTDIRLLDLLHNHQVLVHEMVIGELMLGAIKQRSLVIALLSDMTSANVARYHELLSFVAHNKLYERGIGWVDCHLLASCKITPETTLWTQDKRLAAVAKSLQISYSFELH